MEYDKRKKAIDRSDNQTSRFRSLDNRIKRQWYCKNIFPVYFIWFYGLSDDFECQIIFYKHEELF